MRKPVPLLLALTVAVPGLAAAQAGVDPFLEKPPPGPPESGLSLGVRTGYAIPLGSAFGALNALGFAGSELSKTVSGVVPFQVDFGWRFNPRLYAGVYVGYGFGITASDFKAFNGCDQNGLSCSSSQIRFGGDVVYTILPYAKLVPWVGLGVGYEILKASGSSGNRNVDLTLKGFEFVHVQLGVDYRLLPSLRVGPFVTFTVAQFSTLESPLVFDPATNQTVIGPSQSIDLPEKALHEWFQLGLRATYDF